MAPGGFAILPVPIIAATTIEYPQANPNEHLFWSAPGRDYFDKYRRVFSRVEEFDFEFFAPVHQTYLREDRTRWPIDSTMWRLPMPGSVHVEVVPVCYM